MIYQASPGSHTRLSNALTSHAGRGFNHQGENKGVGSSTPVRAERVEGWPQWDPHGRDVPTRTCLVLTPGTDILSRKVPGTRQHSSRYFPPLACFTHRPCLRRPYFLSTSRLLHRQPLQQRKLRWMRTSWGRDTSQHSEYGWRFSVATLPYSDVFTQPRWRSFRRTISVQPHDYIVPMVFAKSSKRVACLYSVRAGLCNWT